MSVVTHICFQIMVPTLTMFKINTLISSINQSSKEVNGLILAIHDQVGNKPPGTMVKSSKTDENSEPSATKRLAEGIDGTEPPRKKTGG